MSVRFQGRSPDSTPEKKVRLTSVEPTVAPVKVPDSQDIDIIKDPNSNQDAEIDVVDAEPKVNGHATDDVNENDAIDHDVTENDVGDHDVKSSPKTGGETKAASDGEKDANEAAEVVEKSNEAESIADSETKPSPSKKRRRKRKVKDYPWGQIKKKRKKLDVSFIVSITLSTN